LPDSLLLTRARRGDQDAVAELYRDHVGAAMKYARAIAPSAADAEDLVAESFARVIAQLALDRGPDSSFRAYLFTTMRHRLYSTNRREYSVADESVLDRPVEDRAADERADHVLLKQAFDSLGPQEQEVLLLLDVHELRPSEVCDRLGLRASALSMRVARARSALAEAYLVAHIRPAAQPDCQATRQQLGRHVRGKLSALRSRQVTTHLNECDPCTDALAEVTKVNRSLRALPIFGLPSAPRGWRAALRALRGSHALGAPTAAKVAVVAATIAAGSGAAISLVSAPDRPAANNSPIVLADRTRTDLFVQPPAESTARPTAVVIPSFGGSTERHPVSSPVAHRDASRSPATPHRAVFVIPSSSAAVASSSAPSSAGSESPAESSPASSGPATSSTPTDTASESASPTPSMSSTASSTSSSSASPTPSESESETDSDSPTATPSETDDSTAPTCEIFDLHCWWVNVFG